MRILILLLLLNTIVQYCDAQIRKVYGKDFDYKTLCPKDTFSVSSTMPPYYVCCTYNNNKLCDIKIFMKEKWMKKHQQVHAKVLSENNKTFFVYDAGYMRTGGYGRLFSKKAKFTDTAMLVKDTLIFKTTSKYRFVLHFITDLFSDSTIVDNNKMFSRENEYKYTSFAFSNFEKYKRWFSDTTYSRYYKSIIFLKSDNVIQYIKSIPSANPMIIL